MKRFIKFFFLGVFLIIVLLSIIGYFKYYLFIYRVDSNQYGVERFLGKYLRTTEPGLHLTLPYPIIKVDLINALDVKQVEIGFRTKEDGSLIYKPDESEMLTGDENIVDLMIAVQYVINDPKAYLFSAANPEEIIINSCKAATRNVIGKHTIDEVFTTGKSEIEGEIAEQITKIWDDYNLGLTLLSVLLQKVSPPAQVSNSFKDVVNAREDKTTYVYEATGYRERVIREAKAEALKIIQEAMAYKTVKVNTAHAEIERYNVLSDAYRENKDITKTELYLNFLSKILKDKKVYIVDKQNGNLLKVLEIK